MLQAIDIGNSTTKFGISDENSFIKKLTISTVRTETADSIYSQIIDQIPAEVNSIVISTVVKELKETYKMFGIDYFKINPFFADHTFDFGFEIKYFPPENCGSDRLVAAFAALAKNHYESPLIVCDFGTATTIDVVNDQNQFLGGVITPGPSTLGSALFEKTSKLPMVDFEIPENVIGNSTVSSIKSGIYYGYIGLVDGIIERMFDEVGERAMSIVSTGGFAEIIAQRSKYIKSDSIYNNLLLEGLSLINKKLTGIENIMQC